jgi:cation transporter-like permease
MSGMGCPVIVLSAVPAALRSIDALLLIVPLKDGSAGNYPALLAASLNDVARSLW